MNAVQELVQSKNMGLFRIRANVAFFISEDGRINVVIGVVVLQFLDGGRPIGRWRSASMCLHRILGKGGSQPSPACVPLLNSIDNATRTDRVRHHLLKMRASSNHVIHGATDIAGAWVGSSQGANCNKEIIVDISLTDINDGSSGNRRCTCNIFTLNGMDGCSGMWSLMARFGKVLGSL